MCDPVSYLLLFYNSPDYTLVNPASKDPCSTLLVNVAVIYRQSCYKLLPNTLHVSIIQHNCDMQQKTGPEVSHLCQRLAQR